MRQTFALLLLLISASLLTNGCSREEEKTRSTLDQAQEKLRESMVEAEQKIAEGTAEARKAMAAAAKHWDELRPEVERAYASLEDRVEKLVDDQEALKRLPPQALEKIRERLEAMRKRLAEAQAAHDQGHTDLAVEKADAAQQERAAVEELLVEKPDSPAP